MVKNCKTCAHCTGTNQYGRCMRAGNYWEIQRRYPDDNCDANFSGWEPKPPRRSLLQWMEDTFWRRRSPEPRPPQAEDQHFL